MMRGVKAYVSKKIYYDAYGIAIEGELTPGSRFYLRLPDDASGALPLERRST